MEICEIHSMIQNFTCPVIYAGGWSRLYALRRAHSPDPVLFQVCWEGRVNGIGVLAWATKLSFIPPFQTETCAYILEDRERLLKTEEEFSFNLSNHSYVDLTLQNNVSDVEGGGWDLGKCVKQEVDDILHEQHSNLRNVGVVGEF